MKYGNATKKEWLEWLKEELTSPIKVNGENLKLTRAFMSLLTDKKKKKLIKDTYESALCWTESSHAKMLKPQSIILSTEEEYVYNAYIQAYEDLM